MNDDLITQIKIERRWDNRCSLVLTYHNIQCSQRGRERNIKWTIEDTARALGYSIGYVSECLKLAKAFVRDDDLRILTRDEALRRIRNGV